MLLLLKTLGTLAAIFAIVPLMVWAGTGSVRHALHALREYLFVLGWFAVLGVGCALLVTLTG